jgi:hypothetical protein
MSSETQQISYWLGYKYTVFAGYGGLETIGSWMHPQFELEASQLGRGYRNNHVHRDAPSEAYAKRFQVEADELVR